MNRKDIWTLYTRELRSALRERNIVVNSILIPILLYPLLMWLIYTGITFVSGQNEALRSRVVLSGLPAEHENLRIQIGTVKEIELVQAADPQAGIQAGEVDAVVEFLSGEGIRTRITYDGSRDQSSRARTRVSSAIGKYRDQILEQ